MIKYSKYANKSVSKNTIPISSKKSILSSFFSKKYIPCINAVPTIIHDSITPIYMSVYIHYGPICLKRSIIFFSDFVSFQNYSYSLNCAKYNDNLFEIYLKNLKIRIDDYNIYNYIKIHNQPNN